MMSEADVSEVLEGYALETPSGNDPAVLRRWMDRYPQFADDLMDFAAARAVARHDEAEEVSPEEEARYRSIGMRNLAAALGGQPDEAIASITGAAETRGLKKPQLAKRLGLSLSMLMYLEKRRLEFASIPQELIRSLAAVLEASERAVAAYLSSLPDPAAEASYKATARPEQVSQKSFAAAVSEDQQLTAEEKRRLLEMR